MILPRQDNLTLSYESERKDILKYMLVFKPYTKLKSMFVKKS